MATKHDDLRWQEDALCKEYGPELFFPDGEKGENALMILQAKDICAVCPVLYECLAEALDNGSEGVWGGTTLKERRTIRKYLADIPWRRAGAVGLAYVLGLEMPLCESCGEHRRSNVNGRCHMCRSLRAESWEELDDKTDKELAA
jgi:WhiB family transcriptional regulator, redox-sensing transcriptional regulator